MKILHIGGDDKFIKPFYEFMQENGFNMNEHFFYLIGICHTFNIAGRVDIIKSRLQVFALLKKMNKAEKIILHGLFSPQIILLLFLQPWLLKKCYWVIWGGDLYYYKTRKKSLKSNILEFFRRQVINKIANLVTYVRGDYELAKKWYGANSRYHECFMYPSNFYKYFEIKARKNYTVNIQIGNSAAKTNNHLEILEKLLQYKNDNIQILCPLSYGDHEYAKEVINNGQDLFGDKFIPITEFMPFEKYLDFLGDIDIAIFAHKRQQAMGNTISLLGLGKKVYIRNDTTQWQLFEDIGVKVFDVENIDINLIDDKTKAENTRKIKEYFSEEKLVRQLRNLFKNEN